MSIQKYVSLNHADHTYLDLDGRKYTSVSHVLKEYENAPDWESIAGKVAGRGKFKEYPTKKAVLDLWKSNAKLAMDYGTGWHNAIERYQKEFVILEEDKVKEDVIKEIASHYKDFYRVESEATLYHPDYFIAGTSDKILFPKKNSNVFCVADYKTALQTGGIDYFHKDDVFMAEPISHLSSSKYSKYNMQLSIYALMTEILTGMKCRNIWVTFIKEGDPLQRVPMPYLKNESISLLKHFHNKHQIQEAVIVQEEAPDFSL